MRIKIYVEGWRLAYLDEVVQMYEREKEEVEKAKRDGKMNKSKYK